MTTQAMLFHLQEAMIHLRELYREIDCNELSPVDDAVEVLVDLAHIQEHLCLAWHERVPEKLSSDSLDTHGDPATIIPNWNLMFRLEDPKY